MALYIGTNYHPHDWPPERWPVDIQLMKEAGFNTVRLGHLCWDSYESDDGVYTFEWFDRVMDLFAEAGIQVVLDIPVRPAPGWVHSKCPGCGIYGTANTEQASLTRYMTDVDDPSYQQYALRFARVMADRYKDHRALLAYALDNELGSGYPSYSPAAAKRFQAWIENKYGTIENLNNRWQLQRWSRRVNHFADMALQENGMAQGHPSAWLGMRRFFSNGVAHFLIKLSDTVRAAAPDVRQTTNHYSEHRFGFDYFKYADKIDLTPGVAHYPEYISGESERLKGASFYHMHRLWEYKVPIWLLEFQTGTGNNMQGPYGLDRMHAFLFLLLRAEMVLGWTWRTMLAGEEQFLYGLIGHDAVPTKNYDEYKQIAADFLKLGKYAFPYVPKPQIAVAYNYENRLVSMRQPKQFDHKDYNDLVMESLACLIRKNYDYNLVDIRHLTQEYRFLLIPAYYLMEEAAAETIRRFVETGGTAVMTGFSAMLTSENTVFDVPRPGMLDDVFGIRVAAFERTNVPWKHDEVIEITRSGAGVVSKSTFYEELELKTAAPYAEFAGKHLTAVSVNSYGRGKAYYIAADVDDRVLSFLLPDILNETGLPLPLDVPDGVRAKKIAPDQYFFVNTLAEAVSIQLPEGGMGVLTGKYYDKILGLPPLEAELIVTGGERTLK